MNFDSSGFNVFVGEKMKKIYTQRWTWQPDFVKY